MLKWCILDQKVIYHNNQGGVKYLFPKRFSATTAWQKTVFSDNLFIKEKSLNAIENMKGHSERSTHFNRGRQSIPASVDVNRH